MHPAVRGPRDEGILRAAEAAPCSRSTARWVLAATILGSSLAFIDGTVVNVALPVLQKSLGASASEALWVIEAYLLFLSSLVLMGGSLGDRFGRRRVFNAGVALFAVTSAACGLAENVEILIAARAVQGIGGALLVPSSLAILGAAFPPTERGRAVGTWSALTAACTAVGPVLGGWLVQVSSWRAVFFLNLPIAVAVLAISFVKVPESRGAAGGRLDIPGALCGTAGLGGLVYGLLRAPDAGWQSAHVLGPLALGVIALAAFARIELRSPHPMVPPKLFRIRAFAGANLLTFFLYAALSGAFFFLPFVLIQAQGYSPATAGATFLPMIVLVVILSRWSGAIADRVGPRLPLTIGPAIVAAGFLLLAVPGVGARYTTGYLPAMAALGLGLAIAVSPLTASVLGSVGPEETGVASGINNAVARVAGLIAIAALGIVATRSFDRALDRRLAAAHLTSVARSIPAAERLKLGAAQPPPGLGPREAGEVRRAISESLLASFRVSMAIAAGLAVLASATAALTLSSKPRRTYPPPPRGRMSRT